MIIQVNIVTVVCFAIVIAFLILQVSYLYYKINNIYKDINDIYKTMKVLYEDNTAFINRFKENTEIFKNIVEAINHHTIGINSITSRLNKMQGIDIN